MKLSLNWLKDYVDPKLRIEELVHKLTMAGLEVEEEQILAKDTVLDLEITPNRPDCLSMIGLAREVSAITAKKLQLPKIKTYKTTKSKVSIVIEDKKDCGRYIATLIKSGNILSSSTKMIERISSLGMSPINNAVDVTNFVLMELGQPLHVFDMDKLIGRKVIVRRARSGEKIVTLDGIERKLDPSILVIADAQRPVAIAGIMGGIDTAISDKTKNILLESANFDMGLVRRASRTLGIKSDSSYRFERGVDEEGVLLAANRATDLLVEMTKGKFDGRLDVGAPKKIEKRNITLSIKDIEDLLGTKASGVQVKRALISLGFKVAVDKKGSLRVIVPSFRADIKQAVDLIEEVARIIGYDNLEVSLPRIQAANITPNLRPREIKRIASNVLIANGYNEIITYSLINQKDLDKSGLNQLPVLTLRNSLSAQYNILRPSMLPSLLSVAATNFNRGQKDLKLFEIGKRYYKEGERPTIGILLTGKRMVDWRNNNKESADFYDLKGVVQKIIDALNVPVTFQSATHPSIDPSACSKLVLNGEKIGTVGRVDAKILANWDIKTKDIYFAGIHIDDLYNIHNEPLKYKTVAEFPGTQRDVSIAISTSISYSQIKSLVLNLGGDILTDIHLIEEYTGEKIQDGKRGLVFSLNYQSPARTLREEEVNTTHERITNALIKELGANLR